MDDIKGNLRGRRELIMKNRIRESSNIHGDGTPFHKSEFALSDHSSVVEFLSFLKNKCGVNCFEFKDKYKKKIGEEIQNEVEDQRKELSAWRDKTRGLREPDKSFQEKAKRLL